MKLRHVIMSEYRFYQDYKVAMANHSPTDEIKICPKILIVCDDSEASSVWTYILQQKGWITVLESCARNVFDRWTEEIPELIVIDLLASQTERIGLCRKLRAASISPILLFFPTFDETQIIEAYKAGVDECVVKPISPVLFTAKVTAWLRRSWTVPVNGLEQIQAGKLTLDPGQRAVISEDETITRLTNLEYRLLHLLMSRPSQVLEASKIIRSIWGSYGEGDSVLLKNVIYRLRRKVEPDPGQPRIIQTWPGGYSFQEN